MTFKLRHAIKDAALTADNAEAKRILEAVPGDWRTEAFEIASDLTPKLRLRLAGVCLRFDLIDAAVKLLLPENGSAAQPPVEAIVLDPQFTRPDGHHDPHDRFYLDLVTKAGLSAAWVHPPAPASVLPAGVIDLGSLTHLPLKRLFPAALGTPELSALNRLVEVMFQRSLPVAAARLIIVPTAFLTFIEGLAMFVAALQKPPALLLCIHEPFGSEPGPQDAMRETFRAAFDRLRNVPELRLLVVTESPPIAEGFRNMFGDDWEVVAGPVVAGTRRLASERALRERGDIVAGFVGRGTTDRGVRLLPEIAKRTLADRPDIGWRIQLNPRRSPDPQTDAVGAALEQEIADGAVDFIPRRLDATEYAELLESIDIMVMPFDSAYQLRSSGLPPECLSFGIVMVVPEGSTMARLAADYDAGYVTFAEREPDAIAAAIGKAAENIAVLRGKSADAAKRFGSSDGRRRVEQFIEAA